MVQLSVCVKYKDLIRKCVALLINTIVYEYQFRMISEYAVKLLTFVNGKFYSEMLTTCSLVKIHVVKEKMLNHEF